MKKTLPHFVAPWQARLAGLLLTVLSLGTGPLARAVVFAVDKASDAKPEIRFAPEVEEKIKEYVEKLREAKTKVESERVKAAITDVAKVTGLDEAGQAALAKPADAAVATSIQNWLEGTEKILRQNFGEEVSVEQIDQAMGSVSDYARNVTPKDYVQPAEQPVWNEGLASVLSAEQLETWKTEKEKRDRAFDEEIKGFVAFTKQRVRIQNEQLMQGKISVMKMALKLDDERAKKLDALGDEAAAKSAETIEGAARKTLLNFDAVRRKQILKNNGLYVQPEEDQAPEKQAVWTEGLGKILTAEELAQWETAMEQRKGRREETMAHLLVMILDQNAAFTASQREQLLPIAERVIKTQPALFPDLRPDVYYNLNPQLFYSAGAQATEEELKAILDPTQLEHWLDVCKQRQRGRHPVAVNRAVPQRPRKPGEPAPFEPEELENAVSDYFYELAGREQDRALAEEMLRAEDAIRVAGVEGKAADRLRTAARGVMETNLNTWKTNVAQNMRAQLAKATPADVRQRLGNMGVATSRRVRTGAAEEKKDLFDTTVAAELNDSQRAAWNKELEAREAYRQRSVTLSLLMELDRLCFLTPEQMVKLEPIVTEQIEEYGPDMDQMFGYSDSLGWFIQPYYALTPVAGVPEKTMREILVDEQWKQWIASNQYNNGTNYWKNIESNHKRRVKAR